VSADRDRRTDWGVAAPHPAATDAAAAVLATGGTAVDAAIAAAGVLTVVYPHNCSVGGDLVALVRPAGATPRAVFGVGRAAAAIDAGALRRKFGDHVPVAGPFSISVPGVVSGWQAMWELGGRRPFAGLLEPAVALASEGAVVSPSVARALQALDGPDGESPEAFPGLADVFGPRGRRRRAGDLVVQPRLAETLARVAADPESYYRGELAARLVKGLESAGSPIRLEDFSRHRAVVDNAVTATAGAIAPRLFTAGLPSQGVFFAALAEIAGRLLADGFDLTGRDAAVLARAFSEISSIRDDLLSDPSRSPGPDLIRARVGGVEPIDRLPAGRRLGRPAEGGGVRPSGDTVAVVTFDEAGNSVSMLQSVFHSFGSRILDPATGVLFHNRQSMFTLRPGTPGELLPGLMPPHTLCPAMVDTEDGSPSAVLSTMGGRGQPQILAQVLLQLAAGTGASEAVSAPRYIVGHSETGGSHLVATAEGDLPEAAVSSLVDGGFDVRLVDPCSEETGHAQLLRIGGAGVLDCAADPRSDGSARRGGPGTV
jgi:gamma-glutamyltranspeptidase